MIKRTAAFILILTMVAIFAGCERCGEEALKEEEVTLKWVILGPGILKDSEMVWERFNEELKSYLPNTRVEFEVIPASEYSEKWRLIAAGEKSVDLVWTGYANNFLSEVQKNAFLPLNDLLKEYGSTLFSQIPQWALDRQTIGGKVYAVPCMQMMVEIQSGLAVPQELYDKYMGDERAGKIEKIFTSDKKIEKSDYRFIEEYLENLKKAGKLGKGVSPTLLTNILPMRYGHAPFDISSIGGIAYIENDDKTLTLHSNDEKEEKELKSYEIMSEWYKKGYIRKDILEVTDYKADIGVPDGYVMWKSEDLMGSEENESLRYGMDVKIIPYEGKRYIGYGSSNTNTAIAQSSKNPERAMQLLVLMNTEKGKDLLNLLSFGIEGRHYVKTGENRIRLLGEGIIGSPKRDYGYNDWSLGNALNSYETQYQPMGYKEYFKELNSTAEFSPLMGFTFDPTPVNVEFMQWITIYDEYSYLMWGKAGAVDYKKIYKEMRHKLKLAGEDLIFKEIERQLGEWKAEKLKGQAKE
ncbi:MAG: ABC transporter substrate-binding protein [Clostridia bacterium]|nr:ABC transporter substrate-binding protein [Clostridia bacterium]